MITRCGTLGRGSWLLAAACLLGCGGDEGSVSEPVEMPAEPEVVLLQPSDMNMPPPDVSVGETPLDPPGSEDAFVGCRPALGVSGAPETISEVLILLNTLPKPTTLACFLQALDRPLSLYMTKSDDSLQPAPGARSPRTFIVRGELELSIVLDGLARDTLEFGFNYEPGRSIKAEIVFPLTGSVSESSLFDRVQVTPNTTECGRCHVGEAHEDYPGFPLGVFASDVLVPFDFDEISLDALFAENATCNPIIEPYRCGLLSALLDYGDVVRGELLARPE